MLQAIVITQGRLAHELLNSAESILGRPIPARSVCLAWDASAEEDQRLLKGALGEFPADDRFLLLTDLPGGTPHRVARRLAGERAVVVTGVNLAMVVRLGCLPPEDPRTLPEIADWIAEKGRSAVQSGNAENHSEEGCGER